MRSLFRLRRRRRWKKNRNYYKRYTNQLKPKGDLRMKSKGLLSKYVHSLDRDSVRKAESASFPMI